MSKSEPDYFEDHLEEIVGDIRKVVESESPSRDIVLLNKCADEIQGVFKERLGTQAKVIEIDGGKKVLMCNIGVENGKKPALLLCHYDTVHQEGTLKSFPFEHRDGVIRGPGTFDMKVGLIQGIWAVKRILETDELQRPVIIMVTPDEEIGSMESRELIIDTAKKCEYTVVLEASAQGMIKTGRKGTGRFTIKVKGRAAHAGLEPEKGINSIAEISRIVLALQELNKNDKETTVNVGTIRGGTTSNVVPADSEITIDIRVWSQEEADRIGSAIHSLKLENKEAKISVEGGFDRPPMRPTPKTMEMVDKIKVMAKELGMDLKDTSVGGASDGNLIAPTGVPVIDGFGAVGAGAHSINEYAESSEIPVRAQLLVRVLEEF